MAKNALLLHGTDGTPEVNWFPWLKNQLGWRGYDVWVPQLPGAHHPDMDRYWDHVKGFDFHDRTLIVGHSSGAVTAFGILNRLPVEQRVARVISVAGFHYDDGYGCEDLVTEPFDWKKIRMQTDELDLIYSPDDPYVSPDQTAFLADALEVEPHIIEGSKHFGLQSGGPQFKQFPFLTELIFSPR